MSVQSRDGKLKTQQARAVRLVSHASETPEPTRSRTLVIDDQRLFAEAVGAALEGAGYDVVALAFTPEDGVRAARRVPPHLVVLGLDSSKGDAVEAGSRILAEHPSAKVVAMTSSRDPRLVGAAVKAGFHGYLTRAASIEHLVESLRAVATGKTVIPRGSLTGESTNGSDAPQGTWSSLTEREREIFRALTLGHSTREIGRQLHISPNTVRSHVQALLAKLQVHSRLEAVAFARRHGLLRDV